MLRVVNVGLVNVAQLIVGVKLSNTILQTLVIFLNLKFDDVYIGQFQGFHV